MKFNRDVKSVVGDELDKTNPNDYTKRYFAKGKVYAIQSNDAVHFMKEGFATFVPNPKKRKR